MQRLLILIDGNFWQLRGGKDPRGDFPEQQNSGLYNGVVNEEESDPSEEHVQNDSDKLVLAFSLAIDLAPRSLTNETMPFRQRGHAIEPGGPLDTVEVQFVEQRYKAHLVQNS